VRLERVVSGKDAPVESADALPAAHGRWIGLLSVSRSGVPRLKSVLAQLQARPDFDSLDMPALINALVADGAAIDVQYVHGHWRGVNDLEDLHSAVDFAHAQAPLGGVQDAASDKPANARGA
jgi:phosphoenolpyruvate phosphomutase